MKIVSLEEFAKARKLSRRATFRGWPVSIETDEGEERHWHDPHSGESGSTKMQLPYGYLRRTRGADNEHIDVFVGPDEESPFVFVVDQAKRPTEPTDGRWHAFDEQKVMLGFRTEAAAKKAYLAHYNDPRFFLGIHQVPWEDFEARARASWETGSLIKGAHKYVARTMGSDGKWQYTYPDTAKQKARSPRPKTDDQQKPPASKCTRCKGTGVVTYRQTNLFGGAPTVMTAQCQACDPKTHPKQLPLAGVAKSLLMPPPSRQVLFIDIRKADARGGKYLRREAYTDAKGRRKYRYFYAESALSRDVKVGTELTASSLVKLVVEAIDPDGTIRVAQIMRDGSNRTQRLAIPPGGWHGFMRTSVDKAMRSGFDLAVERRARRAIDAIQKVVPRELLSELEGTDEERFEQLRERAPEVYAKLAKRFAAAGISPWNAKSALGLLLGARGWSADARAVVLDSVFDDKGASVSRTIDTAVNLAGGNAVRAEHAARAVELRADGGFAAKIEAVAKRAEAELEKLRALLAAAGRGTPQARANAAAEALAATLNATAIAQMSMLAQAFPGLKHDTVEEVRKTLPEVIAAVPSPPKTLGASTVVYVSGPGGKPQALTAQYKLVEAADLVASHDPKSFTKRADYPEGVQERSYHGDPAEQAKVIRNAQNLNPQFVVNTNPDAVNGPPIVAPTGAVLGGNSRAMAMQRAYLDHPDRAAALKAYLEEHAHETGFSAADVAAMRQPVLVRVVTEVSTTKESLGLLVRQMNESFTQGMDPRTMQVAMGRKLSEDAIAALAEGMEPDDTLASYLDSKRSERFIRELHKAGVIDDRNSSQYLTRQGKLNEDGKTLVARILVGRLVADADLLSDTQASMVASIARSAPGIMQARGAGEEFDVAADLAVALSAANQLRRLADDGVIDRLGSSSKQADIDRTVDNYLGSLFDEGHPVKNNPRARDLLKVLITRPGPQQMASFFQSYAQRAAAADSRQAGLFGAPPSARQVLADLVAGLEGRTAPTTSGPSGPSGEPVATPVASQGGLFGDAPPAPAATAPPATEAVVEPEPAGQGGLFGDPAPVEPAQAPPVVEPEPAPTAAPKRKPTTLRAILKEHGWTDLEVKRGGRTIQLRGQRVIVPNGANSAREKQIAVPGSRFIGLTITADGESATVTGSASGEPRIPPGYLAGYITDFADDPAEEPATAEPESAPPESAPPEAAPVAEPEPAPPAAAPAADGGDTLPTDPVQRARVVGESFRRIVRRNLGDGRDATLMTLSGTDAAFVVRDVKTKAKVRVDVRLTPKGIEAQGGISADYGPTDVIARTSALTAVQQAAERAFRRTELADATHGSLVGLLMRHGWSENEARSGVRVISNPDGTGGTVAVPRIAGRSRIADTAVRLAEFEGLQVQMGGSTETVTIQTNKQPKMVPGSYSFVDLFSALAEGGPSGKGDIIVSQPGAPTLDAQELGEIKAALQDYVLTGGEPPAAMLSAAAPTARQPDLVVSTRRSVQAPTQRTSAGPSVPAEAAELFATPVTAPADKELDYEDPKKDSRTASWPMNAKLTALLQAANIDTRERTTGVVGAAAGVTQVTATGNAASWLAAARALESAASSAESRADQAMMRVAAGKARESLQTLRDQAEAEAARASAKKDGAKKKGRSWLDTLTGSGSQQDAAFGEKLPNGLPADPVTRSKHVGKLIGSLKKRLGLEAVSTGYVGTGAKAHRRQVWLKFPDGDRVDLWVEQDSIKVGGIAATSGTIPVAGASSEAALLDAIEAHVKARRSSGI